MSFLRSRSVFRPINFEALTTFTQFDQKVSRHLVAVYTSLAATVVAASIGAYLQPFSHICFLLSIALVFAICFTQFSLSFPARFGLLLLEGLTMGSMIGPFINHFLALDPAIVTTAFIGTVAIFVCFSGTALFAQRRSFLYLGGLLSSGLFLLLLAPLFRLFLGNTTLTFELYFGLLVFCGFVIFDTQLIVERADSGHKDIVGDALSLFLDFINIFIRILSILGKDKKKSSSSRR